MKRPRQCLQAALILILLISLTACQAKQTFSISDFYNQNEFSTISSNSVIHQAQENAPEDTLLYIINQPTEEELAELLSYQIVKIDSDAPTTLLAPCKQDANLKLYSLDYDEETETCKRNKEIWSLEDTSKGLILAIQLNYGENGRPAYELYIESGDSYGSFFFELPEEPDALPHLDYLIKQGTIVNLKGLD